MMDIFYAVALNTGRYYLDINWKSVYIKNI